MADYGSNFPYGESYYKDDSTLTIDAVEPIMLVPFEGQCFFLSHRKRTSDDVREYRVGDFLKDGYFEDRFITGS
jgi:hypothetical protein